MSTKGTLPRCSTPVVVLFVLVAALWTSTGAQQSSRQAPIFRLVTFQTQGDLRLGATQGNGESDIVDVHNAIRALISAGAPEVRNLTYVPARRSTGRL